MERNTGWSKQLEKNSEDFTLGRAKPDHMNPLRTKPEKTQKLAGRLVTEPTDEDPQSRQEDASRLAEFIIPYVDDLRSPSNLQQSGRSKSKDPWMTTIQILSAAGA